LPASRLVGSDSAVIADGGSINALVRWPESLPDVEAMDAGSAQLRVLSGM